MLWTDDVKEQWRGTKTQPAAGPRIPDGKHRVKIVNAGFDEKLRAAKWMLGFEDVGDKVLGKTNFMFTKEGLPQFEYTKNDLLTLGVDKELANDLDRIEEALASTIGKYAQVTVITKSGEKYSNMYFNALAGDVVETQDPSGNW